MRCTARLERSRRVRAAIALSVGGFAILCGAACAADAEQPRRRDATPTSPNIISSTPNISSTSPEAAARAGEPLVRALDATGAPGASIPLTVSVRPPAGRMDASIFVVGLPRGARLADATHMVTVAEEEGTVEVTDWSLPSLSATVSPEQAGAFTLSVVALFRPDNGNPMRVERSSFVLDVRQAQRGQAATRSERPAASADDAVPHLPPAAIREQHTERQEWSDAAAETRPAAAPSPQSPAWTGSKLPTKPEPGPGLYLERAQRLMRLGDISAARLILERAMDRGVQGAAFLLAQTHDPRMLRTWKVQGFKPDPERARALYGRAARDDLNGSGSLAAAAGEVVPSNGAGK